MMKENLTMAFHSPSYIEKDYSKPSPYYSKFVNQRKGITDPVITRRLNQKEIHQLVDKLLTETTLGNGITVRIPQPSEYIRITKTANGWSLVFETIDRADINFTKLEEISKLLAPLFIDKIGQFITSDAGKFMFVTIYDHQYTFFYAPSQKRTLRKYLPEGKFDYPKGKVSEEPYLSRLEKENQLVKDVLKDFLPADLFGVVKSYYQEADKIRIRNYLDNRLLQADIISDYLG